MTLSVLVVEHEVDCPPALFARWLSEAGAELDVRRPYAGDPLPRTIEHDALVVLGGPMDAGDDRHEWLAPTRRLIRSAAAAGVPTLGICLGHQLCALAFGGSVGRNPRGQQVGLLDVRWTVTAADDPLVGGLAGARTGGSSRGLHWNDDLVLELSPGAVVLAQTPEGEVQAARFAASVWGVQWHPEVDAEVVRTWAEQDAERHLARGISQDEVLAELAAAGPELAATWRPLAEAILRLARARRAVA